MSSFTDYLETALINAVLRNTAFTSPNPIYVSLHTGTTTDAGGGTEVTTAGPSAYARTVITFSAPVAGVTSNAALVTFPTATAAWGTVTHFAIYDASTAGNMLFHAALSTPVVIGNGDIAQFPPATLTVTLT